MIKLVLALVIGYALGSIPSGLWIGQYVFKVDIRQYGSHNIGGTNAGRVLGKKMGALVILLDALKVVLACLLLKDANPVYPMIAGVAGVFGHCFSAFLSFKGGKGVASVFGFLLSLWLIIFGQPVYFFLPLLTFFLFLFTFEMVSLSSMAAVFSMASYTTFTQFGLDPSHFALLFCVWALTLLVIARHKENRLRILKGEESRVKFL